MRNRAIQPLLQGGKQSSAVRSWAAGPWPITPG